MVELKNVSKTFGKKEARVEALRGIDLSIREGELVAIMGKSGSGKSTLLNILGGMMSMDNGEYWYDGKAVNFRSQRELTKFRRNEVGFVVQYFALADDLNIFQNVALPLKYQGYSRKKIKEMVMEALRELEIEDKAKAYPSELSGGQQQRAAIARAVVKQPRLLLADEPTGNLDTHTSHEVIGLLQATGKKFHQTIVMITHNDEIAQAADQAIRIEDGRIAEGRW